MNNHTTVNISSITILKVLVIILLLWFFFAIRNILILFLISIIISSAIDPLADYLYQKKVPRAFSVLIVYLLFLGIFGMVISLLVPPITEQFTELSQSNFYESFVSKFGGFRDSLERYGIGDTITKNVQDFAGSFSQGLFNATRNILTGLVSALTVLVISFYLSAEENGTRNFVKHLIPFKNQAYVMKLVGKIQRKMGSWVLGQLILSLVIFVLTYAGLLILGVDYALVLALIAGMLEIVPYIGPIISVIPAAFFAFIQNPPLALAVLILYLVVQQLENHLLVPLIMSKSVGLNPILVILGILVGGSLGGLVGAIIAVPLLSGIQVFVYDVMNRGDLNELGEEVKE
ncbi:MAG: AI-2E family transporter [Candidatus Doudnabacteria bacterium]|nr:AI-2E family transporter [Candidatus Doudnabacteria bacterium]